MHALDAEQTAFRQEVASRFGLVPNFFSSAPDAPEIIERLWQFAKAGYLDNPIPALFKERLFVYLSRFCEVRYCIVRHCAFLVGRGHSSGDPGVEVQTIEQAVRLLKKPPTWERDQEAILKGLEADLALEQWPRAESDEEDWIFAACTLLFVEPRRADRAKRALRSALGGNRFEHLMGLLAFIRTAHYWTVLHPELTFEEDARELLRVNEELARLLLEDPEAARCDMGVRLFAELTELREINEKHELEKSKASLEDLLRQKELLLKEVNHRVKNSLQIASSVLQLQIPQAKTKEAADALRSASARVLAIAAVHERLYKGEDAASVPLQRFLADLCEDIGRAYGCPDGITTHLDRAEVQTDIAIPLALIVNELLTNAVKHAGPPCKVSLQVLPGELLKLTIQDAGSGPPAVPRAPGLGTRMVEALSLQLGATVATSRAAAGFVVEVTLPSPKPVQ